MQGASSLYNSGLSLFMLPQCPRSASFVTSRRPQLAYIDLQEIRCTPGLCGACCPAECDLKQLHNIAWLQDNGIACTSLTSTTLLHCIAALCRYLPAFCKSTCCAAIWGCGRSGACLPRARVTIHNMQYTCPRSQPASLELYCIRKPCRLALLFTSIDVKQPLTAACRHV